MTFHLAVLAAAHPAHVSNLRYATETWTPGGTVLAVIIIAVLAVLWLKVVPSGRRQPAPAPVKPKPGRRAKVPARQ